MDLLKGLNDMQQKAVMHTEGPLLILAGAGSGKTRTIMHRISHIILSNKARSDEILALTFTNKAAQEMRNRIIQMNVPNANRIWMSTFHSLCAKVLRFHCNLIGYERNFVIYDTSDQKSVLKECYKELNIDDKMYNISSVLSIISKAKENGKTVEIFNKESIGDFREEKIASIYALYQEKLLNNNAMDFDDLLINTLRLFQEKEDIISYYQNKFKYILVDEYQDTNHIQYKIVNMLAEKNKNLCACGDDDQSIYAFRGADIRNILGFEEDYPNANIIRLEQNYRSTAVIIEAANKVIENNKERKAKKMWTNTESGDLLELMQLYNEREESEYICDKINEIVDNTKYRYGSFSVLYRTNAQSRVFEESFMRKGIPYQIIGGLKFYSRKEVKDIISYLTLLDNSKDDISFKRIVNVPRRGIGNATIEKIQEYADFKDMSLFDIVYNVEEMVGLSKAIINKLTVVSNMMKSLIKIKDALPLSELIKKVIKDSGYEKMLEENKVENASRIENLQELVSSAVEFEKNSDEVTLSAFLENVSLVADSDSYTNEGGHVTLMTLHNAKGLEFPVVFIPGLEEGIFPHSRSIDSEIGLQEERRLCYVGITRAMEKLFLTYTNYRTLYGKLNYNLKSRFIDEIPKELINSNTKEKPQPKKVQVDNLNKKESLNKQFNRFTSALVKEKKVNKLNIHEGTKVKHNKWGIGTVINISGEGEDAIASIAFPGMGIKKIAVNMAPISII